MDDPFKKFPKEINRHIFSFLNRPSLRNTASVCKTWKKEVSDYFAELEKGILEKYPDLIKYAKEKSFNSFLLRYVMAVDKNIKTCIRDLPVIYQVICNHPFAFNDQLKTNINRKIWNWIALNALFGTSTFFSDQDTIEIFIKVIMRLELILICNLNFEPRLRLDECEYIGDYKECCLIPDSHYRFNIYTNYAIYEASKMFTDRRALSKRHFPETEREAFNTAEEYVLEIDNCLTHICELLKNIFNCQINISRTPYTALVELIKTLNLTELLIPASHYLMFAVLIYGSYRWSADVLAIATIAAIRKEKNLELWLKDCQLLTKITVANVQSCYEEIIKIQFERMNSFFKETVEILDYRFEPYTKTKEYKGIYSECKSLYVSFCDELDQWFESTPGPELLYEKVFQLFPSQLERNLEISEQKSLSFK